MELNVGELFIGIGNFIAELVSKRSDDCTYGFESECQIIDHLGSPLVLLGKCGGPKDCG